MNVTIKKGLINDIAGTSYFKPTLRCKTRTSFSLTTIKEDEPAKAKVRAASTCVCFVSEKQWLIPSVSSPGTTFLKVVQSSRKL